MTIEIRQLVLRAVVRPEAPRPADPAPQAPRAPSPLAGAAPRPEATPIDEQALIAACAREVLRQLQRARER